MRSTPRALIAASLLALPACGEVAETPQLLAAGEAPDRGRLAVGRYGCGSCHTIPYIPGADALVGPPLDRIASRTYIAGVLENTPENLTRWIKDPPGVDRLTAMPNLRVSDDDVRDIVAFLSTLR